MVLLTTLAAFLLIAAPLTSKAYASDGRFGIALGTWNYNLLECYSINGVKEDCRTTYNQYYYKDFNDMWMTTYDSAQQRLSPSAFNVASLAARDPSANTQFVWYHYEDTGNLATDNPQGPVIINAGQFNYELDVATLPRLGRPMTVDEMVYPVDAGGSQVPGSEGAQIYVTSGAPGSVRVRLQKEPGTNLLNNYTAYGWRIRLPKLIYKNGYPYCEGCIYKETEFKDFLQRNINFNDGAGNWYTFYILAEPEYPIISQYLEPYEYAAVFNEYVEKIQTWFPTKTPRFMLASPATSISTQKWWEPYYRSLYDDNYHLLSPQSKSAVTFNSADVFVAPPLAPDTLYNGVAPTTDAGLINTANTAFADAYVIGNFFYNLNGKPTLLTQSGIRSYRAVDPPPNSLRFSNESCSWCLNNNDVWTSTEFSTARLAQLFYGNLLAQTNSTHVVAWAYWGNTRQVNWTEALINKTWGDLNHGDFWLTWPILCTTANNCPVPTDQIWPSQPGMVYLKMANGDPTYRPDGAPGWWPIAPLPLFSPPPMPSPILLPTVTPTPTPFHLACVNQACQPVAGEGGSSCNSDNECIIAPTPVPADGNNDGEVDGLDYVIWLTHYNQTVTDGAVSGDYSTPPDGKVDGIDYVMWLINYQK